MLNEGFQQAYQAFEQALQQLRAQAARSNPDPHALQQAFLIAQQLFQLRVLGLDLDLLPPPTQSQVQSYQIEINKLLRLLGMDVMFLQAARQAVTIQQRQAQMLDRIATLLRYCQVLLGQDPE